MNQLGLGEYFDEPMSGMGEYFNEPMSGLGAIARTPQRRPGVLSSLGKYSPALSALGALSADATPPTTNVPATGHNYPVGLGMALLGAAISAGAGYFVGKAVAPSRDKQMKYALWGVAAGLFLGPLGLGIEAAVALHHR